MAWYDDAWDNVDDFFDTPDTHDINDLLYGNAGVVDEHAQHLFEEAFFENNDAAYLDLVEYMWDEYGIDFEEAFDWEDFREWYDS